MAWLKCLKSKRFQIYFYLLVGITNWYTSSCFHPKVFLVQSRWPTLTQCQKWISKNHGPPLSLFDFSNFQCSSPIAYLQPSVSMTIARGDKAIVSCKGFSIYAKGGNIGGACAKHELLKPSATKTNIGKDIWEKKIWAHVTFGVSLDISCITTMN